MPFPMMKTAAPDAARIHGTQSHESRTGTYHKPWVTLTRRFASTSEFRMPRGEIPCSAIKKKRMAETTTANEPPAIQKSRNERQGDRGERSRTRSMETVERVTTRQ